MRSTGQICFRIVLAAFVLPLTAAIAGGQTSPPGAAGAPQSSDEQAVAKANEITQRAATAYRALKTYQDTLETSFDVKIKGGGESPFGALTNEKSTFALAMPNRASLESGEVVVKSNGERLWTYIGFLEQYKEEPAPSEIDLAKILPGGMNILGGHPVARLFSSRGNTLMEIFPDIKNVKSISADTVGGEAVQRISAAMAFEMAPSEKPIDVDFIFSAPADQPPRLRQVRVDVTAMYNEMSGADADIEDEQENEKPDAARDEDELDMSMPQFEKFVVILDISNVKIDEEIPAERFTFTPPEGAKKVDDFDFGAGDGESPTKLVGEPAPDFSGEDLDGRSISLDDFVGKIVLLDFWATWCRPCVQAIPHIQAISEKFRDKPVVVLGVNQDDPDERQRVKEFLDKKKITFRQVMPSEEGEDIGERYGVRGIPTTILIDASGIVRRVHVGFSPDTGEKLTADIEKLLAGEKLDEPGEPAEDKEHD